MDVEPAAQLWDQVKALLPQVHALNDAVDVEKFAIYGLVHHSTAIEGSTLTQVETEVVLDKGLMVAGKPYRMP